MNKTNIIEVVANETGLSKKDVDAVVSATFAAIASALKDGDKVAIAGFGSFEVKESA